jgi:hypothetical protein
MLRRGDIVIERLTGRRTMVIHVSNPEEVTCRFDDGRLEDRFVFELDVDHTGLLDSLFSMLRAPFISVTPKKRPLPAVPRQRIARQPEAH